MKKKSVWIWIISAGILLIFVLTLQTGVHYEDLLNSSEARESIESEKQYHYVMLIDTADSDFWKSIYESAKKEAEKQNVILELSTYSDAEDYTIAERMEMCMASKVDGIILKYGGEPELDTLIKKAKEEKIPVVTVLNDAGKSGSISYVGVNNYQLAEQYGDEILKILDPQVKNITVLTHGKNEENVEQAVYSQINRIIRSSEKASEDLSMQICPLEAEKAFDTETEIWSLIRNEETMPDILVCLNEEDTECAYQALINYNLVGKVRIIGYYHTETILKAVAEGNISAVMELDTKKIGTYCITALTEYKEYGYVNSFYDVNLSVTDKDKAEDQINNQHRK